MEAFNNLLIEGILNPSSDQNGVKFHIIDIFLDEVYNIGGEEVANTCFDLICGSCHHPF
jgi:hypothetical protein